MTTTLSAPPETLTDPPAPSAAGLFVALDLRSGRIALSGELDRGTCGHLAAASPVLAAAAAPVWVLDVRGVTFCDAAGLRVLAATGRAATDAGATLTLVGARPFLRRLLPLAGLGDVLPPPAHPAFTPGVRRAGRRPAGARVGGVRDASGRA